MKKTINLCIILSVLFVLINAIFNPIKERKELEQKIDQAIVWSENETDLYCQTENHNIEYCVSFYANR